MSLFMSAVAGNSAVNRMTKSEGGTVTALFATRVTEEGYFDGNACKLYVPFPEQSKQGIKSSTVCDSWIPVSHRLVNEGCFKELQAFLAALFTVGLARTQMPNVWFFIFNQKKVRNDEHKKYGFDNVMRLKITDYGCEVVSQAVWSKLDSPMDKYVSQYTIIN